MIIAPYSLLKDPETLSTPRFLHYTILYLHKFNSRALNITFLT